MAARVRGGGRSPPDTKSAFRTAEARFATPRVSETTSISIEITAPTILALGDDAQKERWIRTLRRCDEVCCQLFSEPSAGSDLGAISLRAVRAAGGWRLNDQKVWTSGAHLADVGYTICRTEPASAPRREAFTAFLVPMSAEGVEVRPLQQMTGGSSSNEVFFHDVWVADDTRLDLAGAGWEAMTTALGFERAAAARGGGGGGPDLVGRLLLAARHMRRTDDPIVRQTIADI